MARIRLHSGRLVDPLNLDPALVVIEDVAYALSNLCRYAGHTRLSVAQHCCMVADEIRMAHGDRQLAFDGLMHDATEAFGLLDLPAPIKHLPEFEFYRLAEEIAGTVLARVFNFTWPEPPVVKAMDVRVRLAEQRDLMGRKPLESDPYAPVKTRVVCWQPARAESGFLQRYRDLRSADAL